ncbi:MAG: hypothetical protein K2N89_11610 [Lachnospiraceae bacterium]|nr:hypothetical protein [Lachnospiraceae bacterium]
MKNKRIAAYLCTALLLTITSCGSSEANSNNPAADTINFNDEINKEENTVLQSDNIQSQADHAQLPLNDTQPQAQNEQLHPDIIPPQADNTQAQSDSELEGSIESIGNNSVVINKTFNLSENMAVSYGDSEKVLITVYFSEETEYEVWTVRNGGVNGDSDIEKRQGAFSDLKEQTSIKLTGGYEGNDFHAKQVVIYQFV